MSEASGEGEGGAGEGQGGAGGEGQGGAADLLGKGGGAGGEGQGGEGGDGQGGEGGGAKWFDSLSGDKPSDGGKSNREWAANKNYADPDAAIAALRGLEARFLAGDKLVVPKEGDPKEVFDAFHKATGRPDDPSGYEVKLPEGADGELDGALVNKLQQVAFEAGVPKAAFEAMAAAFNEHAVELVSGQADSKLATKQAETQALRKEWGGEFDANVSHANRAMRALELDMETVSGIEDGIGTAKTMKLLAKLGRGMGEDALLGEGGKTFQMSKVDAQARLDAMSTDKETAAKILAGDKTLVAEREKLQAIVAAHEAAENARKQQS